MKKNLLRFSLCAASVFALLGCSRSGNTIDTKNEKVSEPGAQAMEALASEAEESGSLTALEQTEAESESSALVYADTIPESETIFMDWYMIQESMLYGENWINPYLPKETAEPNDIFSVSFRNANEEQKEKLMAIEGGLVRAWHVREIKTIMGEIPEDMPRLTVEVAERICKAYPIPSENESPDKIDDDIAELFNEVAGAPDLDGGSGIHFRHYYLNDNDDSEYIRLTDGIVRYVNKKNNENILIFSPYEYSLEGVI